MGGWRQELVCAELVSRVGGWRQELVCAELVSRVADLSTNHTC